MKSAVGATTNSADWMKTSKINSSFSARTGTLSAPNPVRRRLHGAQACSLNADQMVLIFTLTRKTTPFAHRMVCRSSRPEQTRWPCGLPIGGLTKQRERLIAVFIEQLRILYKWVS